MGSEFSAKDFRTYGANYHMIRYLIEYQDVNKAIEKTAHELRHTKNISKKEYISN